MGTAATVAVAVAKLGAWPLTLFILWYLIRSPHTRPLRSLLAAALWDLWLAMRGVDRADRHRILVESARAAQNLAPAPTSEERATSADAADTGTIEHTSDSTPDSDPPSPGA
jgi:hypothetical protein